MNISRIYRKRIIPKDLIPLDDDIIVAQDEETLVTKWKTLNPKTAFSHGCSCFFPPRSSRLVSEQIRLTSQSHTAECPKCMGILQARRLRFDLHRLPPGQ